MMRKHVIGNWKMNGSAKQINEVLGQLREQSFAARVSVCVPFPYLVLAAKLLAGSDVGVGAQNASAHVTGAYTGEVSAEMLRDAGCELAIVGHSERRSLFAESDDSISARLVRLWQAGLFGIVCVGETLGEREAGMAEARIEAQLAPVKALLSSGLSEADFSVAYEPIWAIGTGKVASPEQIEAMHGMIKRYLGIPVAVLYGGSVKAGNAAELMAIPNVDGVLVGGASLDSKEFSGICRAAS